MKILRSIARRCSAGLVRVTAFVALFAAPLGCHNQMTLSDSVRAPGGSGGGGGDRAGGGGGGRAQTGGAGGVNTGGEGGTTQAGGSSGAGGNADTCTGATPGTCSPSLQCLTCPSGPTTAQYLCSTACTSSGDCTDPARPLCNQAAAGSTGVCTATGFVCRWQVKCASPLTRIATPAGFVAIASLSVGDLVYSVHHGELAAVPIVRTVRTPAGAHHVVRAVLASGAVLEISESHPTADGRLFGDLGPGDRLGGEVVTAVQTVPYRFAETFDILPASDSGTYFAEGALIGSTLGP